MTMHFVSVLFYYVLLSAFASPFDECRDGAEMLLADINRMRFRLVLEENALPHSWLRTEVF